MSMRNGAMAWIAVCLLLGWAPRAEADLDGPVFPPPGGVDFATGGAPSPGDAGGSDFLFSNFDASAFSALYWGPQNGDAVKAGADGVLEILSFTGINGATASWEGTSDYQDPLQGGSVRTVDLRFDVTVSGLGGTPWLESTTVDGLDPGVGEGSGAVVDVSSGADFTATLEAKADLGAGFLPLNDIPLVSSGLTLSSFFGGFFFDSEVFPFPGGGQRKDVDAFLAYGNPLQKQTVVPPASSTFDLWIFYGDTIDAGSFEVELNGTPLGGFSPSAGSNEMVSVPLETGRNVLKLSVEGQRTDGRHGRDQDRLVILH